MSRLEHYVDAATRANTREAYASATRHFEESWGGFLPASTDSIARYLADHAGELAISTLRQRLAALAQWHVEHGFPDPTKAPLVRKVLRGIRAEHPAQVKQAKPLQLEQLAQVDGYLAQTIGAARLQEDSASELRAQRNRALLLIGFWRGFRGDELTRMQVQHVQVLPDQGMSCYLPRSKGDRSYQGMTFRLPALSRLCPVQAYTAWIEHTSLHEGAVFRRIDRWGNVGEEALHVDSLIPLLRAVLRDSGVPEFELYSAHSLRRGFASWAAGNGWDVKTLMAHVGWRDVQSALRYVDGDDAYGRERIEHALRADESQLNT
jgi:integrase